MTLQRVSSKWTKTNMILKNKGLASYVPTTRLYSLEALEQMLETHTLVYIKPDRGTYGNGVMCAEIIMDNKAESDNTDSTSTKTYRLRYETKTENFTSLVQLDKTILSLCQNRKYLIQQGIRLLRHKGHPFDLRVLVQKTPWGLWESTGIIGRVAAKHKIITNHHSGGTVKHFSTLMSEHMTAGEIENIRQELKELGVHVASQLQKFYPNIKEIGLDVAIDSRWSIWILEVNTKPALFPFKKFFKDPSIYQKVKKYANAYGRFVK
ncbi:YheC/YheD family protein [Paenibacillus dakarensis]|uniref:YheC/YheD family protein n=1 Tax=Paenibacillus dakarensis TaxID=1527293 RepID=UPI0006D56B7B|nr:YheC/YheD family protein [Paenibacillus dakarensis]